MKKKLCFFFIFYFCEKHDDFWEKTYLNQNEKKTKKNQ